MNIHTSGQPKFDWRTHCKDGQCPFYREQLDSKDPKLIPFVFCINRNKFSNWEFRKTDGNYPSKWTSCSGNGFTKVQLNGKASVSACYWTLEHFEGKSTCVEFRQVRYKKITNVI